MSRLRQISRGGTIAVIAPANTRAAMPERLVQIGCARLRGLGYTVKFGKNVDKQHLHTAGTIEERLSDWEDAITDPEVDAIMAVFGGYNSNHLLEGIDYTALRDAGKIVIGYSDVTALLNGIYRKTGLKTLHGPGFSNFCDPNMFPESVDCFCQVMEGEAPIQFLAPEFSASDLWYLKPGFGPRERFPHTGWRVVKEGEAQGDVVGGNLETFLSLAGTPYFPDIDGKILLIESGFGVPAGRFDREMTQLRHIGFLSAIRGLLVGQFPHDSPLSQRSLLDDILYTATRGIDLPIIADVNFSHVDPVFTIPIGGRVSLKAEHNKGASILLIKSIYD